MASPLIGTVSVREASVVDAAVLGRLRGAMFEELEHPNADRLSAFIDSSTHSFERRLRDGSCLAWLAETGASDVIGSTALLIFPRLPSPSSFVEQEGYLLSVYTAPAWRGQGIARAMVGASVAKARELGLARIRLHATDRGKLVYKETGFLSRLDEMELNL